MFSLLATTLWMNPSQKAAGDRQKNSPGGLFEDLLWIPTGKAVTLPQVKIHLT